MALIIRSKYIKRPDGPCEKCKDREVGCHSECQKYIKWREEWIEKKKAFKKYNQNIAEVEEYEIIQRQKIRRR